MVMRGFEISMNIGITCRECPGSLDTNFERPPWGAGEKDFLGDRSQTIAKSPMISRDRSDITKSISCT